jgi:hypothetical protein
MTLQQILLSLSKNKDYYAECFCINGYMTITIKEYWSHREEVRLTVNLAAAEMTEEEIKKLTPYLTE